MPEGRMLKKVITTSQKIIALKTDSARLFYTWLIPFTDCEGRLRANPYILKGLIFPYLSHSPKRIEDYLKDCHRVGLITLYQNSNEEYLQLEEFHTHQSISRKANGSPKKESKSVIPACPDELRNNSRVSPELVQNNSAESKVKGSKSKGKGNICLENFDKEFIKFWDYWPKDRKSKKPHCEMKFRALIKQGKLEDFWKTTHGYSNFIEKQHKINNFKQEIMLSSTWLNNWEGEKENYIDFKYKPRL